MIPTKLLFSQPGVFSLQSVLASAAYLLGGGTVPVVLHDVQCRKLIFCVTPGDTRLLVICKTRSLYLSLCCSEGVPAQGGGI